MRRIVPRFEDVMDASGGSVRVFSLFRRARDTGIRAGIAVSDREVSVAVVRKAGGRRPLVVNCVSEAATAGYTDDVLTRVLGDLQLGRTPVSAVMGAGDYQIVQVEAPEVPAAELRQATRWKLRDQFDFPIESASIDLFDVPATSRRGRARMLFAVAAHGNAVNNIGSAVSRATPGFDVIDIPELCQRNITSLLPQDQKGVALLLLREQFAQLVLTRNGLLYLTRRIELGQRAANRYEVVGAEPDSAAADATIDASALALELQRSLDYYESHFDQTAIGDLVIAPGGTRASTLATALSNETGLRVSTLSLGDCLDIADGISVPDGWLSCMAIGAALRSDAQAA
jgi:MSHA biogenesis protein MshI